MNVVFPSQLGDSCGPLYPLHGRDGLPASTPEFFGMQVNAEMTVSEACALLPPHVAQGETSQLQGLEESIANMRIGDKSTTVFLSRLNKYEHGFHILTPLDPSAKVRGATQILY